MEKISLIFLLLTLISCRQQRTLDLNKVSGHYSSLDTADYYTEVLLRGDSTYVTDQFPGEFHLQNMGQWTIQRDTVILFKGIEFSDNLSIKKERDTKSETLTINVAALQSELGDRLKFSINNTDLKVIDGRINLHKSDFWKKDYFSGDYAYVPLNLDIRIKNGFARLPYIFTAKTLNIEFRTRPTFDTNSDRILCKYYLCDAGLCSTAESYEIERNSLKKGLSKKKLPSMD